MTLFRFVPRLRGRQHSAFTDAFERHLIQIMGLLSFFTAKRDKPTIADMAVVIDLGAFTVGGSTIGKTPAESEFFTKALQTAGFFHSEKMGFEAGLKDGVFEYVFLTIDCFPGTFLLHGEVLPINEGTLEADVRQFFGEPYWVDRSDGETILFYEYASGTIELQFEFPEAKNLGFVTLSVDGVLSVEKQREAYGVNKAWPPK